MNFTEEEVNNIRYTFSVSIKENATNRQAVTGLLNLESKVLEVLIPLIDKKTRVETIKNLSRK